MINTSLMIQHVITNHKIVLQCTEMQDTFCEFLSCSPNKRWSNASLLKQVRSVKGQGKGERGGSVLCRRPGFIRFGMEFIVLYNCQKESYCKLLVVSWNVQNFIPFDISFIFFVVRGSQTDPEGKFQPCYPSMLSLIQNKQKISWSTCILVHPKKEHQ